MPSFCANGIASTLSVHAHSLTFWFVFCLEFFKCQNKQISMKKKRVKLSTLDLIKGGASLLISFYLLQLRTLFYMLPSNTYKKPKEIFEYYEKTDIKETNLKNMIYLLMFTAHLVLLWRF